MIPKIIWQTYETPFKDLLPEVKECVSTWIDKNPDWTYRYMDSKERKDFVLKEFGKEWHDLFINCELNIVQSNIWRCMVVYKYGGLYCDLDTICNEPINNWIKNEYDMTLSRDDDGNPEYFTIHTFAGKPKAKALEDLLEKLKYNISNNSIKTKDVVELSGEFLWADIIKGLEKKYKVYCYKKGSDMFNGKASTHLGTSKKWHENGYLQWTRHNA
jgi:mannosyltransferase OCH1-like enzyme